jgi:hypothetical protein
MVRVGWSTLSGAMVGAECAGSCVIVLGCDVHTTCTSACLSRFYLEAGSNFGGSDLFLDRSILGVGLTSNMSG